MNVIVIGAGLAGLTAARLLKQADVRATVLEADAEPGGRVRSENYNGFTLDRGFQVLFTGYPAVRRNLNLGNLELQFIPPAAAVQRGPARDVLGDPSRDPGSLLSTLSSDALTFRDKILVARLGAELKLKPKADMLLGEDTDTRSYLRAYGFSEEAIENFFAPFFGGIFLERELGTSSQLFEYYYRMLVEGGIAVPRAGMGAIAAQLAEDLELRLNTRVEAVEPMDDGFAVKTTAETLMATHVIVATDPPELKRLTGVEPLIEAKGSSYLYYSSYKQLDKEKRILLNARGKGINNAHWLSNVNPAYAPVAKHLLSVTMLNGLDSPDDDLDASARHDLRDWYGDEADGLELLKVIRVPFAQFAQPPGYAQHLLPNTTDTPGLLIASEATSMSSIQGAMESGEQAAKILLGTDDELHYRGT